ncbi:hypothetical protein GCM10017667_39510 [Streptomyces filamentosus]|uniref:Uncharacterized protein n=1 Tax=Streptomyces filamentosus TaxID=67294 RepID=A0A919BQA4_STRFL|nr:hypothetical protein GCM10017667_39510 [Streptomyces filamentosus]
MVLDRGLPGGGVGPNCGAGGADIGGQRGGVVAVGGLVEVAADPHGAAAPLQRCLDEVGDHRLAGARLACDHHHDRVLLGHRSPRPAGQPLGEDLPVLSSGEHQCVATSHQFVPSST